MKNNQKRSLRALDWLNFFMADVNTGIGPFLAIYLTATRHWNAASVGMVVSTQSIASVLAQGPAEWIVDWSEHKKWLITGGEAIVALGCLGIVRSPNVVTEVLTQSRSVSPLPFSLLPSQLFRLALWAKKDSRGELAEMKVFTMLAT